ncbi:ribosomal protein L22/L17 [Astrocystis sublimbata]|nr:ribosomal protein L22/L17 [Astrocystis sublimbata]
MSLHLPARQVVHGARATIARPSPHLRYLAPREQRRNAWYDRFGFGKKTPQKKKEESTPFAKAMSDREKDLALTKHISDRTQGDSIFDDIKGTAAPDRPLSKKDTSPRDSPNMGRDHMYNESRMKEHMERALNPDPRWKVRYQRKKIMQLVRKGGKETRDDMLKRTEKEVTSKSNMLPTSYKKLGHLSRQIAGKTVDDAIVQMRYSKKKAAREVLVQLKEARAMAIAGHGMGLGRPNGELFKPPRVILTKHKAKLQIHDPTQLYVDQSWVTIGPDRGVRVQYHARGRMSFMHKPTARINLLLKEEKTRIRLHDERVAKEARKKPWVHLPNRPVTAQRQYYSW